MALETPAHAIRLRGSRAPARSKEATRIGAAQNVHLISEASGRQEDRIRIDGLRRPGAAHGARTAPGLSIIYILERTLAAVGRPGYFLEVSVSSVSSLAHSEQEAKQTALGKAHERYPASDRYEHWGASATQWRRNFWKRQKGHLNDALSDL